MAGKEMKRSYGEVIQLLQKAEPSGQSWEQKVRDGHRCGLVKAVARSGACEWVHPLYEDAFVSGRAHIGFTGEKASQAPDNGSLKVSQPRCAHRLASVHKRLCTRDRTQSARLLRSTKVMLMISL
jgi:hypothetical protein